MSKFQQLSGANRVCSGEVLFFDALHLTQEIAAGSATIDEFSTDSRESVSTNSKTALSSLRFGTAEETSGRCRMSRSPAGRSRMQVRS